MAVKFQDSPFVFNNVGGEGGVFTRWTKVLAPSLFFSDTIWAGGFPDGSVIKNPLANAGDTGSTLGQEDPLEKGMDTYCSILPWRIPWTEEPIGLQSMGLQRVRHI